jgi:D-glycero-D-manno-heptose 1,7-bisphosphate phosphatase
LKLIFLDRDGIVNTELGDYVMNMNDFEIHEPIIPFLKLLTQDGYAVVIITNQAGIAKNLYSHELVHEQHDFVQRRFTQEGIRLLESYYCPHHPDYGMCLCRKPLGLLIEKGLARFNGTKNESFMIGDKFRDVQAAEHAGIKGYQLASNPSLEDLLHVYSEFKLSL